MSYAQWGRLTVKPGRRDELIACTNGIAAEAQHLPGFLTLLATTSETEADQLLIFILYTDAESAQAIEVSPSVKRLIDESRAYLSDRAWVAGDLVIGGPWSS